MRETLIRSVSGIIYIAILTASVFFSGFTLYLLFYFFLLVATLEFSRLVKVSRWPALILSAVVYGYFGFFPGEAAVDQILVLISLTTSVMLLRFLFSGSATLTASQKFIFLIGYIIVPFLIIPKIPFWTGSFQPKYLFGMFVLVWVNDTFAYVVGRAMGRNKLMPRISPKKTVEGFAGGLAFAALTSFVMAVFYFEEPVGLWLGIALIMGVFGTLGDLIESKFKRIAGVKDSGNIMPGHGGVLDRLDSVIFASPFVFLLFQILKYVS